ncbi:unnamed protein product, partial [Brenthis ino]
MKYACCKSTAGGATEGVTCIKCGLKYHYNCVNPSGTNNKLNQDKSKWICPECKSSMPRQVNQDNTPVRGGTSNTKYNYSENVNLQRGGSTSAGVSPCKSVESEASFLEQVRLIVSSEISTLRTELISSLAPLQCDLKSLREEVCSFKDSLDFFNNKFEEFTTRITNCESKIKYMSERCLELNSLKSKVEAIEIENNNREQWSRRSNVEIYGIPEKKNENLVTILQDIADKADLNLDMKTDIDLVTRVASKDKDVKRVKPIIVKFLCRWKKDDFLSRVRKLKLKCNDIGFSSNNNYIYFNDHLTSSNKSLLQLVKKTAKEKSYKYVWVKNCSIMVRRSDTSPVLHIANFCDLKKIA